jgi:hypothetical protein
MIPVNDPTGDRTAALIWRYSLYLSALPPLTTLAGLTSSMFLLEASAANVYLLYLADRFSRDHSNANARRVFLCSLWYLPLLLAGYLLHRSEQSLTNPATLEEEATSPLHRVRQAGKDLCLHEILFQQNPKEEGQEGSPLIEVASASLCPKVSGDKVRSSSPNRSHSLPQLVASISVSATEAEAAAVEALSVANTNTPSPSN